MEENNRIPVIIDTDIGDDIDDAFALCLAMASPEINLLGVTTVFKNTLARACIARRLLDLAGGQDIPVAAGGQIPLKRMPMFGQEVDYGEDPITYRPEYADAQQVSENAEQLMTALLEKSPEPVTIVALGALTNIARLLTAHPDLKARIRQLNIMGGAFYINWSEYNFACDPEAADIILNSGIPIRAVGIDVTRFCILRKDGLDRLRELRHPCIRMLLEMCARYTQSDSIGLHDPTALFSVFRENLFRFERRVYRVETQGRFARGICVQMSDYNWRIPPENANTYVAAQADTEAIVSECRDRLLHFYTDAE